MSSPEDNISYITATDILVIHAKIIDETGGSHGVRDTGLLESAVARPKIALFGNEMFTEVFQKAAAILDALAHHHVFTDGNKRTAFAASAFFLHQNNVELKPSNKEVVEFMVYVATKKPPLPEIAGWLKKHSRKIKGRKGR